jgi:hypothetical protein
MLGRMTDATEGYEARIGRYSRELAHELIEVAGVRAGQRALDVGCGTGALTEPLCAPSRRPPGDGGRSLPAGGRRVPSASAASTSRLGSAEALPCRDDEFDAVLAQLVVGLLTDAGGGRDATSGPARRSRRDLRLGLRQRQPPEGTVPAHGSRWYAVGFA